MSGKSGETAQETGDFRWERCHRQTHVTKGHKIPNCPHAADTFDTRYHEPRLGMRGRSMLLRAAGRPGRCRGIHNISARFARQIRRVQ
jgi:hypothetical protein